MRTSECVCTETYLKAYTKSSYGIRLLRELSISQGQAQASPAKFVPRRPCFCAWAALIEAARPAAPTAWMANCCACWHNPHQLLPALHIVNIYIFLYTIRAYINIGAAGQTHLRQLRGGRQRVGAAEWRCHHCGHRAFQLVGGFVKGEGASHLPNYKTVF